MMYNAVEPVLRPPGHADSEGKRSDVSHERAQRAGPGAPYLQLLLTFTTGIWCMPSW